MSLESALEEERLSVMKMLEDKNQKKKKKDDGNNEGGRGRRPVSMLLNDKPFDNDDDDDYDDDERQPRPRSKSDYETSGKERPHSKSMLEFDDPTDPFSSKDRFYYTSESLRPSSRSPTRNKRSSNTNRPIMPGRSTSSYSYLESKGLTGGDNNYGSYDDLPQYSSSELHRLDQLYSDEDKRLEKDHKEGGDGHSSSSDEEDNAEEGDDNDEDESSDSADEKQRQDPSSLLLEREEEIAKKKNIPKSESPANVQKLKYKSLIDVDGTEKEKKKSNAEYAAYKRRIIHPSTAFDTNLPTSDQTPYTSDTEEIMDAQRAAQLHMEISPIHSNQRTKRMIRTLDRGRLDSLSDPNTPRKKSFIVSTDLSPEAVHALEWTIGTVLRDGNVLYVVCAYEDDGTSTDKQQEEDRLSAMEKMTNSVCKLLNKTRLQVHVIFEVMHCKSPKHLLTDVIDHVSPTLVILGSRGRSALRGVLLGSFSNYIVERSSVPVMVARRKLQKTKNKHLNVRLANNLRRSQGGVGISEAKVD